MDKSKSPLRITLILAATKTDPLRKNEPFMPLSLPLLAGAAPEHEYTFIDMLAGEKINFDKPTDLVGISVRITAEHVAYDISEEYRKRNIKVVLGGAQVSAVPHRSIDYADAVVIGEGEPLWPKVIQDFQEDNLRRFYICSPKKFDSKGKSLFQIDSYFNLGNVPVPSRKPFKKKYSFDTVFATRGCPINCDFCSVTSLYGNEIRKRPIVDVVEEINTFKGFYYLLDDTVFGRPSNYDYYLELYDKIAGLKKKRFWTGQANLDAAATERGREVIKGAAKAGLLYAAIGLESLNPIVLKKAGTIKKMGTNSTGDIIAKMKENIRFIQDQGVFISGWFTIGYEEDSIDNFYQSLEFCKELNIVPVICSLKALPGTILYERLKKENKIDDSKTINIIHPKMKDKEIINAIKNVNREGFTFKEIWKRTIYSSKKFEKDNKNFHSRLHYKIFKTIFVLILQFKLKKGLMKFINTEGLNNYGNNP